MSIVLTVDYREKAVFDAIGRQQLEPSAFKESIGIRVVYKTLPIGDYLISYTEKTDEIEKTEGIEGTDEIERIERIEGTDDSCGILAVIERKSFADYAASIKDGRHENVNKLISLRESTKCDVFYLVEGTPNPALSKQFGRMDYKVILGSMRRLQILKNISIIESKNIQTTARELFFLCEVYSGLILADKIKRDNVSFSGAMEASMPSKEDVMRRKLIATWKTLPGIGHVSAVKLAATARLTDLLLPEFDIPAKAKVWTEKSSANFIASIPGLSLQSAKSILSEVTIEEFIGMSVDTKLAKFGKKKIENTMAYLAYNAQSPLSNNA
jgi:ERCC4-type nuclease